MNAELRELIVVDSEKCVNCYACISVCPVKFCNNGSGEYVTIDSNMCLACGSCIDACTHNARHYIDDWKEFDQARRSNEKIIAVVAPAIAANFPDNYLKINTLLKKLGVEAVFDVSFGAELTVMSYLNHATHNQPSCIIAQPCPALVSYIEIYNPQLIPYLAPADSPMVHTIKMIKEYYPQYKEHKVLVISPCIAKRREFDDTGQGDFNVTMATIQQLIDINHIDLNQLEETAFDNPPAERAVLFSTPGGLLETAKREVPDMDQKTRKIEGRESIYPYLDSLYESIQEKHAPFLIDCLNCQHGCNAGPGTIATSEPLDKTESLIKKRSIQMQNEYNDNKENQSTQYSLTLKDYWKEGLYTRTYQNRSAFNTIKMPNERQIQDIYFSMKKHEESEIYNCSSCGYGSCEEMAIAIFNHLNRKENCHHYKGKVITEAALSLSKAMNDITELNESIHSMMSDLSTMSNTLKKEFTDLNYRVEQDKKLISEFDVIANTIANIAYKTDILAINAAIEAARAGHAGRGFNIVADEVKKLSVQSSDETEKIRPRLSRIENLFHDICQNLSTAMPHFEKTNHLTSEVSELISRTSRIQMEKLKEIGNEFHGLVKDEAKDENSNVSNLLHQNFEDLN